VKETRKSFSAGARAKSPAIQGHCRVCPGSGMNFKTPHLSKTESFIILFQANQQCFISSRRTEAAKAF
jgi:hypothetical protein